MPEPTTRAEELLAEARKVRVHVALNGGTSNADELVAEAQVLALVRIGDQLAALVERLGPPKAYLASTPQSVWRCLRPSPSTHERDHQAWVLTHRSALCDGDPDAGWWLTGCGLENAEWMGDGGLYAAQYRADARIAELPAGAAS